MGNRIIACIVTIALMLCCVSCSIKNTTEPTETAVADEPQIDEKKNVSTYNSKESTAKITITKQPGTVERGNVATCTIHAEYGMEYDIAVYYKSGKSTAAGLSSKKADENGEVTWRWKVGGRTSAGTWRVVISGGYDTAETTITVE